MDPTQQQFIPQEGGDPSMGQEQPMQQGQPMPQQGGEFVDPSAPPQNPGVRGAGLGAVTENPLKGPPEDATPEEQAQYEDLFIRAMQAVHDIRPQPNGPSLADALVAALSDPRRPPEQVIGQTAGLLMTQLTDMAKRQGVNYPGPIIQEVGLDVVAEIITVADVSGAMKGIPEEDSPEFQKLFELSALEAAKMFGEWQLQTGQAKRGEHMKELETQFQREAESGELDDWDMAEFDDQFRGELAAGAAKKKAMSTNPEEQV